MLAAASSRSHRQAEAAVQRFFDTLLRGDTATAWREFRDQLHEHSAAFYDRFGEHLSGDAQLGVPGDCWGYRGGWAST
jgi:hypothetical protein